MQRIADGIDLDDGPIHADAISYGRDLCAEFGDDVAVDLDHAVLDMFVGFAARADSGVGHEL